MNIEDLRPHQVDGIQGLRDGWKTHKWHLLNASCGYGKTAIASYLCGMFAKAGKKVIFAAPYVQLVNQTYDRFSEYGLEDLSVIWQKDPRFNRRSLIQIASADTLIAKSRRKETKTARLFDDDGGEIIEPSAIPDDVDVFIWDECDLRRKDLLEALESRENIKVIGLTATPYANWLGTYYTNFVKPCTTNELIEKGWLTPFEIYRPNLGESIERMAGVKTRTTGGENDYAIGEAAEAMMETKVVGDIVGNWLENGENLPTIGFATNKASANAYTREFIAAGVPSSVVVAETPVDERAEIYAGFAAGRIKVLWNVGVLGAGFDSDVRCIIWARPTKSQRVWVQGVMRGSRPAKGKTRCLVFDHTPTHYHLGDPNEIEYYELHDGSDGMEEAIQARKEKTKKEQEAKICGKCGRLKAPGEDKWTVCGHKALGGDAVDCDDSIGLTRADSSKKEKFTNEQKQAFYSELLGYQKQRMAEGKAASDGYIANLYRNKFTVWPRSLNKNPKPPSAETLNYIKSRAIAYSKSRAAK
jgi:superfamily II DNA or RNA helicase